MFSDILSTVKTTSDRDQLLRELVLLRNSQFQSREELEKIVTSSVDTRRSKELLKMISDPAGFKKNIGELFKQVHSLKVVELTVGFGFSDLVINKIYQYLIESIGYQIIIKMQFEPHVLGGAIVAFEGKYIDLSIEKKVNDYFTAHHDEIIEEFKSA